jgi:hypothetical protein
LSSNERLEQPEASHISLMTEHELEAKKNDRAWRRHRRWLREYDSRIEQDRMEQANRSAQLDQRFADLGDRIDKLVSGIGELVRINAK